MARPHKHVGPATILVLTLAAISSAQLGDLPDLSTITGVLGASITAVKGSSKTASAKGTATTGKLITTTRSAAVGGLTDAPTLYGVGVPPLIVPDTSGAPFQQRSDLPEGFVFICVGAILGVCALAVLAWRGLVAWSLHRSVKRSASMRYMSEKKSMYGAPSGYSSNTQYSSDVSLEPLAAKDTTYKGAAAPRHHNRSYSRPPPRESRQPTFFSPTAAGGQNAAARASTYLPAGYYASSSAKPAAGSGLANFGGPPTGYARVDNVSQSPERRLQARDGRSRDRLSALDVPRSDARRQSQAHQSTRQPTNRAPSAVLDELFDNHSSAR